MKKTDAEVLEELKQKIEIRINKQAVAFYYGDFINLNKLQKILDDCFSEIIQELQGDIQQ